MRATIRLAVITSLALFAGHVVLTAERHEHNG
jgi:hypothetical protein